MFILNFLRKTFERKAFIFENIICNFSRKIWKKNYLTTLRFSESLHLQVRFIGIFINLEKKNTGHRIEIIIYAFQMFGLWCLYCVIFFVLYVFKLYSFKIYCFLIVFIYFSEFHKVCGETYFPRGFFFICEDPTHFGTKIYVGFSSRKISEIPLSFIGMFKFCGVSQSAYCISDKYLRFQ